MEKLINSLSRLKENLNNPIFHEIQVNYDPEEIAERVNFMDKLYSDYSHMLFNTDEDHFNDDLKSLKGENGKSLQFSSAKIFDWRLNAKINIKNDFFIIIFFFFLFFLFYRILFFFQLISMPLPL